MDGPSSKPTILIGVCTLNEAENIGRMVQQLRLHVPEAEVLIVDDSSEDGTAEMVQALISEDSSIRIDIRAERGLGGAIRHAMLAAMEGDYELFINLDGDFSHDPARLPDMVQRMLSDSSLDVVIGSRYVAGGDIVGWPLHRKIMSRLVNRFATLCLRLPVKDCSGSMRCYRVSTLREAKMQDLASNGYSVLEEILLRLTRHHAKMCEIPITFTDRTEGVSKLTLREAIRSMWKMMQLAFS